MPYADPTRSAYCAARHLLRRLDDAAALRRNPPIAPRDAAVAGEDLVRKARALVDRALTAMDAAPGAAGRHRRRQAAILLRCDVLREPRAAVARDMGISLPLERHGGRVTGRQ